MSEDFDGGCIYGCKASPRHVWLKLLSSEHFGRKYHHTFSICQKLVLMSSFVQACARLLVVGASGGDGQMA
ncbi:hypothetical protein SUGI_0248980 [Cryptomeria japonica]|nr:hypothetical protein SUGI_0248980 [Cryptomeria japonica]